MLSAPQVRRASCNAQLGLVAGRTRADVGVGGGWTGHSREETTAQETTWGPGKEPGNSPNKVGTRRAASLSSDPHIQSCGSTTPRSFAE